MGLEINAQTPETSASVERSLQLVTSMFSDGSWVRPFILNLVQAALDGGNLPEDRLKGVAERRKNFEYYIKRVSKSDVDSLTAKAAFGAVEAAFGLGLAIGGNEQAADLLAAMHKKQAALARKMRAEKPVQQALLAAIRLEHGEGPVGKPTKEATAILEGVNQRLRAGGFAAVKLDKVRRRLEKFPRS